MEFSKTMRLLCSPLFNLLLDASHLHVKAILDYPNNQTEKKCSFYLNHTQKN